MKFKGNFGELTLNINGTVATGTYQENGVLKGEFINNTFKGQWENKGMEGLVAFTITDNNLEGNWKKGLEPGPMKGKWEGKLVDSISEFINYWEKRIVDWFNSHNDIVYKGIESRFYIGKSDRKLVGDAFPEPYLGDPYAFSCVIINLNPGGVLQNEQNINNGTFVVDWKSSKSYLKFAKQFIYLKPEITSGFWVDRKRWINRLLELKNINSTKQPFALEIIPFHSKSFGNVIYNEEFKNYMLNHLLPVAEQASIYSDLKVIVTVGKSFFDTFKWLGFKKIIEVNHENHPANIDWPTKIDNDAVKRNFSIWESISGKLYYNTWHIGGNKMPSRAWKHIEASLLSIVI